MLYRKKGVKLMKLTNFSIINTKILVEWNDNPKLVNLDNEMPTDLQVLFDEWLSSIEHERNCVEGSEI